MTMFENENPIMPMADDGTEGGGTGGAVTLAIATINQRTFPEGNPDSSYQNAYCLATCYLAIAKYYNPNSSITMTSLENDGIVARNNPNYDDGYLIRWGGHFDEGSKKTPYSASAVRTAIANGYPVILGDGSHFAVAYSTVGSTIKVMDPWNGVKGNLGTTQLNNPPTSYRICKP